MKLHVLSDLHTEFADFSPPETDADVVILAGDIGVGLGGIEGEAWFARRRAKRLIEDFAAIQNGRRRFTPEYSVELHEVSKAWLVGELKSEFNGPTVIVTHHLPASTSVAKRYANDSLNPAFVSRLEDVIEKYRPELWVHGHTHVPCDYELFDTRIVCNPGGYPGENRRSGFRGDLVVSIG
jgi:Icc-related predicted phosphoesterase